MAIDQRIDRLETRVADGWQTMDQATREKARASMRTLHQQRVEVAERYGSLESSSADAWNHMKQGVSEAVSSLQEAWENSEEELSASN